MTEASHSRGTPATHDHGPQQALGAVRRAWASLALHGVGDLKERRHGRAGASMLDLRLACAACEDRMTTEERALLEATATALANVMETVSSRRTLGLAGT